MGESHTIVDGGLTDDCPKGLSESRFDDLAENRGLTVLRISRAEHERYALGAGPRCEGFNRESRDASLEFAPVASAELLPALGTMSVPTPKFIARRDISIPLVDRDALTCHPARPEAIDQHAVAVIPRRRIVGAAHPNAVTHGTSLLRSLPATL